MEYRVAAASGHRWQRASAVGVIYVKGGVSRGREAEAMTGSRRAARPGGDDSAAVHSAISCQGDKMPTHPPTRAFSWAALLCAAACLVTFSSAYAHVDAGSILRDVQGTPTLPKLRDAEMGEQAPLPRRELSDVADLRLDIKGFTISGVPEPEIAAIREKLAPFIGPDKTFQDLLDAAALVKGHVNSLGYLLAQAYIPEQKLQDGVVEIVVLLGRLGKIELNYNEDTRVSRSRIQAYIDRLETGKILRTEDLERVLFLINDLHGVRAKSTIRPGSEPGTADLVLDVEPDQVLSGQLQIDDMGSRYTGTNRLTGNLVIGSPLGLGDSLSLRVLGSQDGGTGYGSMSYVVPVGSDGLRLGLAASYLTYTLLTKEDIPPGEGRATDTMVFVLYPIVRSRNANLFVQAGYDYQKFVDIPDVGQAIERKSSSTLLTLSGDLRDGLLGGGISNFSLGFVNGSLDNPTAALDTPTGHFQKWNPFFSRLQALGNSEFLAFLRYVGQMTSDRLDSYQKFALGGPNGVRAYPVGEAPGDVAHLVTVELRYPLPNWDGRIPGSLVGALFMDWGQSKLDNDPPIDIKDPPNRRTLSGYGLGLNWATAKSWSAQGSVAWRQQGELINDPADRHPRVYVQITRYF